MVCCDVIFLENGVWDFTSVMTIYVTYITIFALTMHIPNCTPLCCTCNKQHRQPGSHSWSSLSKVTSNHSGFVHLLVLTRGLELVSIGTVPLKLRQAARISNSSIKRLLLKRKDRKTRTAYRYRLEMMLLLYRNDWGVMRWTMSTRTKKEKRKVKY